MIGFAMLIVGVLVAVLALALVLRRLTLDEVAVEDRLHEPARHSLSYVVPTGQDPAVLMAALSHHGIAAVSDMSGGTERLLVECRDEQQRRQVRAIIEDVHSSGIDGSEMSVAHVSFEDER